jgi:hypothetical protein
MQVNVIRGGGEVETWRRSYDGYTVTTPHTS